MDNRSEIRTERDQAAVGRDEQARDRARLEERARALARPLQEEDRDVLEVMTFTLAQETYAIETHVVWGTFRLSDLTPLPGARAPIYGVTAWRGELLTILDLRQMLGVPSAGLSDMTNAIVLGGRRPSFGILADEVQGVRTWPTAVVTPPAEHITGRELLRGITRDAVVVIDGIRLLELHA